MKKYLIVLLAPLLFSYTNHKYYLSVMDLEYNQEAQSVQMITRIFYDDLEDVLNERYELGITVDATADQEKLDRYLEKYIKAKISIKINGEAATLQYIGKAYEADYVVCYIEIPNVSLINSFTISNELLMDLFPDQKNMVHTSINGKKSSFILTEASREALLNFSE